MFNQSSFFGKSPERHEGDSLNTDGCPRPAIEAGGRTCARAEEATGDGDVMDAAAGVQTYQLDDSTSASLFSVNDKDDATKNTKSTNQPTVPRKMEKRTFETRLAGPKREGQADERSSVATMTNEAAEASSLVSDTDADRSSSFGEKSTPTNINSSETSSSYLPSRSASIASTLTDAARQERNYKIRQRLQRQQELSEMKVIVTAAPEVTKQIESTIRELQKKSNNESTVELLMKEVASLAAPIENRVVLSISGDMETTGIQILTSIVNLYPSNETIQREGLAALAGLACGNHEAIVGQGGMGSIVRAMSIFPQSEDLQAYGCLALGNLAGEDDEDDVMSGVQGGMALVIKAMANFPDNDELQDYGCFALGSLACHNDENRAAIGMQGGMATVIKAMRNFSDDELLQDYGCFALGNLSCNNDANCVAIRRLGGVEMVIEAMTKFPKSERLQRYGCFAIGCLAYNDENCAAIGNQCGPRLVIKAMTKFANNEALQDNGCLALGNLSCNNNENRDFITANGGLELTISAMKRFPTNQFVRAYGLCALGNLTTIHVGDRAEICLDLVVASMKEFPSSEKVLQFGCFALESWASLSSKCRAYMETLGGVRIARDAWTLVLSDQAKLQLKSVLLAGVANRCIFDDEFLSTNGFKD